MYNRDLQQIASIVSNIVVTQQTQCSCCSPVEISTLDCCMSVICVCAREKGTQVNAGGQGHKITPRWAWRTDFRRVWVLGMLHAHLQFWCCIDLRHRIYGNPRSVTFPGHVILIYQGVHCCTKVCNLHGITDCKGSDTTWELRMGSRSNLNKSTTQIVRRWACKSRRQTCSPYWIPYLTLKSDGDLWNLNVQAGTSPLQLCAIDKYETSAQTTCKTRRLTLHVWRHAGWQTDHSPPQVDQGINNNSVDMEGEERWPQTDQGSGLWSV